MTATTEVSRDKRLISVGQSFQQTSGTIQASLKGAQPTEDKNDAAYLETAKDPRARSFRRY